MYDDDDATVLQTEEDRKKLTREIQSGRYDVDSDDDTTVINYE